MLLAPSERAVLDVLFETPGEVRLEHRTPDHVYDLGTISVTGSIDGEAAASFDVLRTDAELTRRARTSSTTTSSVRPTRCWRSGRRCRSSTATTEPRPTSETAYHDCPMHPEVAASFAGTCPKCGMTAGPDVSGVPTPMPYACPMHDEIVASWAASCPLCGMTLLRSDDVAEQPTHGDSVPHSHGPGDSIEWEDDMVAINRQTNTTNMIWQLIDRETGAKNGDISWKFTVGDRVKIRLVNEMGSDHPMPHPFHVHGAGRFLVLSKDGVTEPNLAWKDTVLLLAGQTVDILLYVTNPGLWMAHCHIAEHNQSGMMFSFDVAPRAAAS